MSTRALVSLCVVAIAMVGSSEGSIDPGIYFLEISKHHDLTKVTWAHAVNNQSYLDNTLKNESILMIEADVIIGKIKGGNGDNNIPIMGHPPAVSSDLSLENFLDKVFQHNQDSSNTNNRKGIKLDMKTTDAVEETMKIVDKMYENITYPIWFNSDIIKGPLAATTEPVDYDVFFNVSLPYKKAVYSLGWTTNYGGPSNITVASYTDGQIDEMVEAVHKYSIQQSITFAVRAGIAARSYDQMKTLKDKVENCTITIWSSEGDSVRVDDLKKVISLFGVDRVYIDVPEELREQLELHHSSSVGQALPSALVGATLAASVLLV